MTEYRVSIFAAPLFEAPSPMSPSVDLPRDTEVSGVFVDSSEVWLQVTARPPGGEKSGFMLITDLVAVGKPEPEPVADAQEFCLHVTNHARRHGVQRDYLMALAWSETGGLTKLGNPDSSAIGPFQFTKDTWAGMLTQPAIAAARVTSDERRLWRPQTLVAAVFTAANIKRLQTALGRVPLLGELYFTHMFGQEGGPRLLADGQDRDRPFDVAYTQAFSAEAFAKVKKGNASVIEANGAPRTVAQVLQELSRRLDSGYVRAAQVIDTFPGELRFFQAENGDPPWLMVAREEAFRGVYEYPGADNNSRISQYLSVSGVGKNPPDEVPWCGAFLAFCLKDCGDAAAAASVRPGAAQAADWLNWGQPVPAAQARPGDVIVLKPQAAGSTGHVGFYVAGAPAGKVRVLGGNQGQPQHVSAKDFDAGQVVEGQGFRRFPAPGA
jgi:uncharacterized protein (TIGR02594 family)